MKFEALYHDPNTYRETALVRVAIKRLGLDSRLSDFHDAVAYHDPEAAATKRLTFEAFHGVVEHLPMRFASPPATGYFTASAAQVADLLAAPDKSRLIRLQAETRALIGLEDNLAFGLVFRYGGVRGGHVLHDGGVDVFGDGIPIVTDDASLILTRFYTVLDHLAAGLTALASRRADISPVPFDRGLPIRPGLRRSLGCGVEAQVYALIEQLCGRQLPRPLCRCAHWIEGDCWALMTQGDMASLIGCSAAAVKRAIASLQERGLVESRRTTDGNAYRCVLISGTGVGGAK